MLRSFHRLVLKGVSERCTILVLASTAGRLLNWIANASIGSVFGSFILTPFYSLPEMYATYLGLSIINSPLYLIKKWVVDGFLL